MDTTTTQEQIQTQELNQERSEPNVKTQQSRAEDASTTHKTTNWGLGIFMLILAIIGLIPGIGAIVRGTLKLQQKMGNYPKNKNSLISKLPGNIPNVLSMFFIKSK